jgi:hypothetical protein
MVGYMIGKRSEKKETGFGGRPKKQGIYSPYSIRAYFQEQKMFFLDIGPDASQIFGLLTTLFWVWMLVDCIRNNRLTHKGLWVLFILFTHGLGALVYFFTRGPWLWIYRWAQQTPPFYQASPAPKQVQETYPSYEQGYQAQEQQPVRRFEEQVYEQPSYSVSPLQPQYEEPQIAYPEEPPIQQH